MISRKLVVLAALSFSSLGAVTGCAAPAEKVDGTTSSSVIDIKGDTLSGSWTTDSGAFRGLIFSDKRVGLGSEFIADIDTGIRCVTTPCPSSERVVGTFTTDGSSITFESESASDLVQKHLGTFGLKIQGKRLTLSRKDFTQSFEKVVSYCAEEADCYVQDIAHPECLGGGFTCSAKRSCEWTCEGSAREPGGNVEPTSDFCSTLGEDSCMSNKGCEAMWGPSSCQDGFCTTDLVYTGCKLH